MANTWLVLGIVEHERWWYREEIWGRFQESLMGPTSYRKLCYQKVINRMKPAASDRGL